MLTIRIGAKRRATFPPAVCKALNLAPGDEMALDTMRVHGTQVWILRPLRDPRPLRFGRLRRYARGKRHGMQAIRKSIGRAGMR